jgi:hypothetical protein
MTHNKTPNYLLGRAKLMEDSNTKDLESIMDLIQFEHYNFTNCKCKDADDCWKPLSAFKTEDSNTFIKVSPYVTSDKDNVRFHVHEFDVKSTHYLIFYDSPGNWDVHISTANGNATEFVYSHDKVIELIKYLHVLMMNDGLRNNQS